MSINTFVKAAKPFVKISGKKALKFIITHRAEAGLTAAVGIVALDDLRVRKSRNQEREKYVLYQKETMKIQAEINTIQSDNEREEYKNRLWAELQARKEN